MDANQPGAIPLESHGRTSSCLHSLRVIMSGWQTDRQIGKQAGPAGACEARAEEQQENRRTQVQNRYRVWMIDERFTQQALKGY